MLARVAEWFKKTDDLELYFLIMAGLAFSALGLTGLVGQEILAPATLALLAVLAFSQLRTRRELTSIYGTQRMRRTALFESRFPPELGARRAAASEYLYIGRSMARTAFTKSAECARIIARGGIVKVVVADPTDDELIAAIARVWRRDTPAHLRRRIYGTLHELASIQPDGPGSLEVRVLSAVVHTSMNIIDPHSVDGLLVIQRYEQQAPGKSGPNLDANATRRPLVRPFPI